MQNEENTKREPISGLLLYMLSLLLDKAKPHALQEQIEQFLDLFPCPPENTQHY